MFVKDQNDAPKDFLISIQIVTFQTKILSFLHMLTLVTDAVVLSIQTKTISTVEVLEKILIMATFGSTIAFVILTVRGKAEFVDCELAGE
jgi:hypothetical protein